MSSEQSFESSQLSQSYSTNLDQPSQSQLSTPSEKKAGRTVGTQTTTETDFESNLLSSLDVKPSAHRDQHSDATSPSTPDDPHSRPRQVIAVSASKGPAAFFNLARKFLVTDELCDLSALEGAIVSAADAAHLLERSKLATIVRVQTSYVTVEPKRKVRVSSPDPGQAEIQYQLLPEAPSIEPTGPSSPSKVRTAPTRELRRARIIITVKRTESYKKWLQENPLHALSCSDVDEDDDDGDEDHAIQTETPCP